MSESEAKEDDGQADEDGNQSVDSGNMEDESQASKKKKKKKRTGRNKKKAMIPDSEATVCFFSHVANYLLYFTCLSIFYIKGFFN